MLAERNKTLTALANMYPVLRAQRGVGTAMVLSNRAGWLCQTEFSTVRTISAELDHEKLEARLIPAERMRRLSSRSDVTESIASTHASTSRGGTSQAAPPAVSGIAVVFEQITGVPHAMASRRVSPNPSAKEGDTKASAP